MGEFRSGMAHATASRRSLGPLPRPSRSAHITAFRSSGRCSIAIFARQEPMSTVARLSVWREEYAFGLFAGDRGRRAGRLDATLAPSGDASRSDSE